MAVNLYPDTPVSLSSSPRISFSHDLDHQPSSDHLARSDQNLLLTDPSSNHSDFDFDFGLPARELSHETSPADELFSDGFIIPTHMKERNPNPPPSVEPSNHALLPLLEASKSSKETEEEGIITTSTKASLIREEKGQSKSFWKFMRSSSLNCDSSHGRKGSIWSSLPLLARSNSTGSSHSPNSSTKHGHGRPSAHSSSYSYRQLSKPSSSSSSCSGNGIHQKPPLGKGHGGSGFGISGTASANPVLNVPPPYITKGTSDLLGFGSLFRHGNHKKAKKR